MPMGQKLPPEQLALYRRVDEILHYKWDPIGVSDIACGRDEYYGYLPTIFSMVIRPDIADQEIASHLTEITVSRMGLKPDDAHDLAIAQLLLSVRDEILEA